MAERRYRPRPSVSWEAECQTSTGDFVVGTIRDAHSHGFFFTPEADLEDGEFFGAREAGTFAPGEPIVLTFTRARTNVAERMLARLRWRGRSTIHGCEGYGIEVVRR